jgi:hypothetical protein
METPRVQKRRHTDYGYLFCICFIVLFHRDYVERCALHDVYLIYNEGTEIFHVMTRSHLKTCLEQIPETSAILFTLGEEW